MIALRGAPLVGGTQTKWFARLIISEAWRPPNSSNHTAFIAGIIRIIVYRCDYGV
jgi:hypothetical protein